MPKKSLLSKITSYIDIKKMYKKLVKIDEQAYNLTACIIMDDEGYENLTNEYEHLDNQLEFIASKLKFYLKEYQMSSDVIIFAQESLDYILAIDAYMNTIDEMLKEYISRAQA